MVVWKPPALRRTRRLSLSRARGIYKGGIVRDKRIVTMRFMFRKEITSTLPVAHFQFRCNDVYDPDVAFGGYQPRGFDEFMTLYDNYAVIGSKMTLIANSSEDRYQSVLGIRVDEANATIDATIEDIIERKGGTFRIFGHNFGKTKMKYSVNTKKWFGATDPFTNLPQFQGSAAGGCSDQIYYTIACGSADATENGPVRLIGWIDYRVMLLNPKKFGAS